MSQPPSGPPPSGPPPSGPPPSGPPPAGPPPSGPPPAGPPPSGPPIPPSPEARAGRRWPPWLPWLLGALLVALGAGVAAAASSGGDDDPTAERTTSTSRRTTSTSSTTTTTRSDAPELTVDVLCGAKYQGGWGARDPEGDARSLTAEDWQFVSDNTSMLAEEVAEYSAPASRGYSELASTYGRIADGSSSFDDAGPEIAATLASLEADLGRAGSDGGCYDTAIRYLPADFKSEYDL